MAVAVIMPRQGQSVESCIITKWNKKVGDSVSVGDVLFAYETDKASFEEEAKVQGTLLAILAEEGDDIPCLENVCVIGAQGDDISAFTSGAKEETPAPAAAAAESAPAPMAAPAATASAAAAGERMKISPRAKGIAQNQMLDLSQAVPTGPNGRIIERDVLELS
ncbi:MAG: biotin/lipoyl-containing protein, partial [Christensenellaceae bacterium]